MRVILEDNKQLIDLYLPKEIGGNYWIKDSNKDNILNIIADNNNWVIKSNNNFKILKDINYKENELLTNVNQLDSIILSNFLSFFIYELKTKKILKIYILPTFDHTMIQLVVDFSKTKEIIIGNNKNATINCSNKNFNDKQIIISFEEQYWKVVNNNPKVNMFINNILETEKRVNNGDVIFIEGLMISIIGNLVLINNPNDSIFYDSLKLAKRLLPNNPDKDYSTDEESFVEFFNKSEYFQRPPRFRRSIEEKDYNIDPPSGGERNEDEMPLVYTLAPMILMGTTSLMSGMTAIINVLNGKSTFKENMTPIITAIVMMLSTIIFPLLQKLWNKSNKFKKERRRVREYKKYIDKKKKEILQEIEIQKQILIENNLDPLNVADIIINRKRTIWDRKLEHDDFLTLRLGIGNVKPLINVNIPEEHFSLDRDKLDNVYNELFESIKDIESVPVTINLVEKNLTGIVGNYSYLKQFIDGLMLQTFAFHSYDMLKVVILSSEEKKSTWEKYKNIPHLWNNDKTIRFLGFNINEINKVSNSLIQILNERIGSLEDNQDTEKKDDLYKNFKEYYLIISDELDYLKNTTIFNELIKTKENLGFSLLLITENIDRLPNECTTFINVDNNNSGIFENELVSTKQRSFIPDIPNFNMNRCYTTLCNIPVDIEAGKFSLPKSYSFLEMYDAGNVNQLNILNRWKSNNPIQSLECPVGINEQGESFLLDLHEKMHGPHGLVAGMTGSGKSEWIITYILSMAVNYHPDEVQFVLIDYKGGGLAGTFENKETGVRLPHLAGTITNLDISEINRSLASINSELKRRQSLFNQARDKLGESSVDIYKYQKWYRENKIDTPISHLFIISDEFAELKSQQPEFMQELISTARIGRSLGVHLILATQKPSGVVDDQIWSNSKFRVCLKVQDKSDSNDMIRVPDAAYIKETGRFYLQVGYNEYFAKGQSAYAGSAYYESETHKKTVDTDISFINNVGEIYKDINSDKKIVSAVYKGEELPNILKEIIDSSKKVETHVKKLWLDPIPESIYVDELLKKYKYTKENYVLNPVIGEYDAPQYQKQDLLTLPISKNGNTLIYGIGGSGKEKLLTTILYSLMITHFKEEVNVYILDFGAEVLNCFKKTPIVGDIITSNDTEKIKNYYKFIINEFERRKNLFQDYNGDYYTYIKKSGKSLPIILTIINNMDNYNEIVGDTYNEVLGKLTREAEKVGIIFIITTNSVNGIGYRLSQNFKQSICLQMNDTYDYRNILGNTVKTIPSNNKGRGVILVNEEDVEFQTADPTKTDDLNLYLSNLSTTLYNKQNGKAVPIKTLPEIVDYDFIKDHFNTLNDLPIGVYTESLDICKYNYLNDNFNIVTSQDTDLIVPFIKSLVELISMKKDTLKVVLFDGDKYFNNVKFNVSYIDDSFLQRILAFNEFLNIINNNPKQYIVIFTGLNNITKIDNNIPSELVKIFDKIKTIEKVNVLFADSVSDIEKYMREQYFSDYINKDNGLFIGDGIDSQFILNVKKISRDMREEIKDNSGYIITKGKANKIQLLELFKEE